MTRLVILALTSYALTFIVASSSILDCFRRRVMVRTPRLKVAGHRHFIECRMCVGFWVSMAVCLGDWHMVLPVYGASYFLATQERN
jgi:hypothetical protein